MPDPLNAYRPILGQYAQGIDDAATLYAPSLVGRGEEKLATLRGELSLSLASELDPERAALAQSWDDVTDADGIGA